MEIEKSMEVNIGLHGWSKRTTSLMWTNVDSVIRKERSSDSPSLKRKARVVPNPKTRPRRLHKLLILESSDAKLETLPLFGNTRTSCR
ncbi:uncharacterized protein G2W53_018663 [Senna tora]|uniref:Uncharacterized protein n=1 Tax=Senna tora TaxID=362788 RepID=A0A834TTI3_9FABA|nr:uncharacterized protein G2W53_018663 [Senna tora]